MGLAYGPGCAALTSQHWYALGLNSVFRVRPRAFDKGRGLKGDPGIFSYIHCQKLRCFPGGPQEYNWETHILPLAFPVSTPDLSRFYP